MQRDEDYQFVDCLTIRKIKSHFMGCHKTNCPSCRPLVMRIKKAKAANEKPASLPMPCKITYWIEPSFYFKASVESIFGDSKEQDPLSPLFRTINKPDFCQVFADFGILGSTVTLNPFSSTGIRLMERFVRHEIKCAESGDSEHLFVSIVFHGTDRKNIESIFERGLNPHCRRRQMW
jgi:hypothetical protein